MDIVKQKWAVVIRDINGGVIARHTFWFWFTARRRADRDNAHARRLIRECEARAPGVKMPAPQLYTAQVELNG